MTVRCYDIWMVDFGNDILGSEQGGRRPAVVIQNNTGNTYSDTTIVIPLTTRIKKLTQPTHTLVRKDDDNGLAVDSMALAECTRQVSFLRLKKKIGRISTHQEQGEIRRIYMANMPV